MAVVVADIHEMTAEFATYDDADIEREITRAQRFVSEKNWGERYDDGVLFLALHYLTVHARSAAPSGGAPGSGGQLQAGPKKWEQMGVIQRGYANPAGATKGATTFGSDDFLQSTSWGQEFLSMRALVFSCRVL